ncbi:hypothetical protein CLJU_c10810 [Clostridium ljungdahlii DSM 13528]|uniref:Uncharacterized protein n=1 Tax=Clostridium ljungdahlii (strain ATCC 55383 / DSM 13528 / PETC) TaxID=748727 RepID=D8GQM6_CLOLD|nr:hypothetical protein CLJU_c10810 [Clostridium ljungdahlii DSM 13528]
MGFVGNVGDIPYTIDIMKIFLLTFKYQLIIYGKNHQNNEICKSKLI